MTKSLDTKYKLADTLLELMKEKPITSITIKDITNKMNCNRNTFYYHFTDIYDLVNWIFEMETAKLLKDANYNDHKKALETIFSYIEENKKMISFIYSSIGRDKLREMIRPHFKEVINDYYKKQELINNDKDFIDFIIEFYSAGIANSIIKYINSDYQDKEKIINYILLTIKNSFYLNNSI